MYDPTSVNNNSFSFFQEENLFSVAAIIFRRAMVTQECFFFDRISIVLPPPGVFIACWTVDAYADVIAFRHWREMKGSPWRVAVFGDCFVEGTLCVCNPILPLHFLPLQEWKYQVAKRRIVERTTRPLVNIALVPACFSFPKSSVENVIEWILCYQSFSTWSSEGSDKGNFVIANRIALVPACMDPSNIRNTLSFHLLHERSRPKTKYTKISLKCSCFISVLCYSVVQSNKNFKKWLPGLPFILGYYCGTFIGITKKISSKLTKI